jgi:predicted ribosome quality control (RQC) complex YloA/Tae2 family protein
MDFESLFQVILYNKKEMKLFNGRISSIIRQAPTPIEITDLGDTKKKMIAGPETSFDITLSSSFEPIELDTTTMIRISKYNKEKEIEELNEKISNLKEKEKRLKLSCDKLYKRLSTCETFIKEFIEGGYEEESEYFYDKYKNEDWEEE